jgi:AraC-like DNA-binding protein
MAGQKKDEWVRYWCSPDAGIEAMHARFREHTYHLHSHETYSFGVTESGAQSFTCRGAAHTSAAGMVMAFNPDDPHDGQAVDRAGFAYRIVHIAPGIVDAVLADATGWAHRLPLFAQPVIRDPLLASSLRRLHAALAQAGALELDEWLTGTVLGLVARGASPASRPPSRQPQAARAASLIAIRIRSLLSDAYAQNLGADQVAAAAGCSRYAAYRAFRTVYGLAPSDYQRLLRLRAARHLLAAGTGPAEVAAAVGFADQAHLTRWFVRSFGIAPGAYAAAAASGPRPLDRAGGG